MYRIMIQFCDEVLLVLFFVGIVICYSPFMFTKDNHSFHTSSTIVDGTTVYAHYPLVYTKLYDSLSHNVYLDALKMSLVINVPLVCDLTMDAIQLSRSKHSQTSNWQHWLARLLVLFRLGIPNMLTFVYKDSDFRALNFACASGYRHFSGMTCFLYFFRTNIKEYWKSWDCTIISTLFLIADSSLVYSLVYEGMPERMLFYIIYAVFMFLATAYCAYIIYLWIVAIRKRPVFKLTSIEYCGFVYILAVIMATLAIMVIPIIVGNSNMTDYEANTLASYTFIQVSIIVVVTVFPSRSSRIDTAQVMDALDNKRSFVRYISHEIRTPMNTISLGLQYLNDILEKIGDHMNELSANCHQLVDGQDTSTVEKNMKQCPSEGSINIDLNTLAPKDFLMSLLKSIDNECTNSQNGLHTLTDIRESCDIAINILNDLLVFDKLESGIMTLDRHNERALNFYRNAMRPFYVQAKQANVKLNFIVGSKLNTFNEQDNEYRVISLAQINIDKHKLSQVVRNLVSNALKFSKPHSEVNIRVYLMDESRDEESGSEKSQSNNKSVLPRLWPKSKVDISERFVGPRIRFEVEDFGAGISEDNQKKIFNEVVQFNAQELQGGGGSGFGLWISKGLVQLHGGKIGVFSEGEGLGSMFFVDLPCQLEALKPNSTGSSSSSSSQNSQSIVVRPSQVTCCDETEVSSTTSAASKMPNTTQLNMTIFDKKETGSISNISNTYTLHHSSKSSRTAVAFEPVKDMFQRSILIVDDSTLNRKMLDRNLKKEGFLDIRQTDDGDHALEIIAEELRLRALDPEGSHPVTQIVLLDFIMVRMNGPPTAQQLRNIGYKGVIIGVTGNALPSDIHTFISCGADAVLTKPVDLTMFQTVLQQELVKRRR